MQTKLDQLILHVVLQLKCSVFRWWLFYIKSFPRLSVSFDLMPTGGLLTLYWCMAATS